MIRTNATQAWLRAPCPPWRWTHPPGGRWRPQTFRVCDSNNLIMWHSAPFSSGRPAVSVVAETSKECRSALPRIQPDCNPILKSTTARRHYWGCGSSSVGGGSGRFFGLWRGPEARPEAELATHSSLAGAARTNQLFAVLGLRYAADRIAVSLLRVHVCKPLPMVVLIVLLAGQRFKKCLPEPLPQFLFSWGLSWPSSWGRRQRPSGVYG